MNKSLLKTLLVPILVFIIGIMLQFFIVFKFEKLAILNEVDNYLFRAAKGIELVLGRNYVKKEINKNTFTKAESVKIGTRLHEYALEQGVDYLYLLIRDGDDIRYVALSDEKEYLEKHPRAYYWFSLKDAEDDSIEATKETFENKKMRYIESKDLWDSYRSIYLYSISEDGTEYIAGADITVKNLNGQIASRVGKILLIFWLVILFTIPLITSFVRAIKDRESMKKQVMELDTIDILTGVYNRSSGMNLLNAEVKKCKLEKAPISIGIIDIQNLKEINSRKGRQAGDDVLKIVGNLMRRAYRKTDIIIRLESDKFLVVFPGCTKQESRVLSSNFSNKLSNFNKLNLKEFYIRVHYHFAEYNGINLEDFIDSSISDFMIEKKRGTTTDNLIQSKMLKAVENNEFIVYFQPKISLETNIIEYEALIRWNDPERGIVSPGEFIPLAEKSFIINKLTEFVLKESLDAARILNTSISVNISPVLFENHNFLQRIKRILIDSIYKDNIKLEITEGIAIKDIKETKKKMDELRKYGIKFAIDDFGIGYSSLSYLEQIPMAEVKIDKLFIRDIMNNKVNQLIVKFLCEMGRLMNFEVIAEGTEGEEEIKELLKLGCYTFQGYYFDRPQPLNVIIKKEVEYLEKIKYLKS